MADLKIASHALLTFSVAVATSPTAVHWPHHSLALTELQVRNFEYVTIKGRKSTKPERISTSHIIIWLRIEKNQPCDASSLNSLDVEI